MKKTFLIILTNLMIILILFSIFEYLSYKRYERFYTNSYKNRNETQKKTMGSGNYPYHIKMKPFNYETYAKSFRKTLGNTSKNQSIVILGCSIAYGDGLMENQTLGYKLYKSTHYTIFTRAHLGWGPQHMLYQMRKHEDLGSPKYFIYVYMFDHKRRLFQPQWYFTSGETNLRYKEKKGVLVEEKPLMYRLWGLYSIRYLQELYEKHWTLNPKNEDKVLGLLSAIIKESNRLIKKEYPGSKFIIIKYQDNKWLSEKEKNTWSDLRDSGISIIEVEELLKDNPNKQEYLISDGNHPNEKAWDIIAPELAKRLDD